MSKRHLLVGVGSAHGCDQVGWQVAKRVQKRPLSNCDVRIALTPADLLDWLEQYDSVHICDACSGDDVRPGDDARPRIHRWLWPDAQIASRVWVGTHDFSLPAVLQLATTLGMAPQQVILWGIEVPGGDGSAATSAVIEQVVEQAAEEIRQQLERTAAGCTHA